MYSSDSPSSPHDHSALPIQPAGPADRDVHARQGHRSLFPTLVLLFGLLCFVQVAQAQLAGEWRMDERNWSGTAGEVLDSSGGGHHGVARGRSTLPETAPARVCNGGWFRGQGYSLPSAPWYVDAQHHVEIAHAGALSPQASGRNAEIALSGWFRAEDLSGTHTVLHKGEGGASQEYRVHIEGGQLRFSIWEQSGGVVTTTFTTPLAVDRWYFFYLDGSRSGASSNVQMRGFLFDDSATDPIESRNWGNQRINLDSKTTTGRLYLGATNWGGSITNFFDGYLDEIRLHAGRLTDAEVRALRDRTRTCETANVAVEYRFDECTWDGTPGEVIDSSGNARHANSGDATEDSLAAGVINNSAVFSRAGQQFVRLPALAAGAPNFNNGFTIATWARFDGAPGRYERIFDLGDGRSRHNIVLTRHDTSRDLFFRIWGDSAGNVACVGERIAGVIEQDVWAHWAVTVSPDRRYAVFKNGSRIASGIASCLPADVDRNSSFLARSNWSGDEFLNGAIDEFKVFDAPLTPAAVSAIHDLERAGRGLDGTPRAPVDCAPELTCIGFDFNGPDNSAPGPDWSVTNSSGRFGNPRLFNSRLRITDASANVATSATLQRRFPSAGNLVSVEFDFFAYGGSGADGVSVVLSDARVTPAPGGYGGSLGYAQRSGSSGFAGGWLGIGLDSFGNFSNPSEGRQGGPGRIRNSVAMRGSGSLTSGYRFIEGTDALSPTVRNDDGHRYRITLDSRTPGESWATIERRTSAAADFLPLVGPVDVMTSSGQSAVPENLLLTLTGSTGGSNDNHEIDNLEVCAIFMEPLDNEVNHYRIEHDGQGLTCQAEPVTIKACANDDCTALFSGQVDVTLSPTHSSTHFWLDGNHIRTFSGGEAVFELRRRSPGSVALAITDSLPAAAGPTRCFRSGVEGSCTLEFSNVGILIDGDDSLASLTSPIPAQLSGKPSNTGLNAATQRIRVVRTSDETGACIPAVAGQSIDARFRYLMPNTAQALADNRLEISADSTAILTSAGSQAAVRLGFGPDGSAPFSFLSHDAGRYQLEAALRLPMIDSDGDPTGETLELTASSSAFAVRPLAVFADAAGNPQAADASGSVFTAAGEPFSMRFAAVRWSNGMDTDADGRWDACDNPLLANPGNHARVPAWSIAAPGGQLVMPAGEHHPGLTYASAEVVFGHGASQATADPVTYGEVGIIRISGVADLLGEAVPICTPHIGRFTPASFRITHNLLPSCGGFTYAGLSGEKTGQPFDASGTITALNTADVATRNYVGPFAKLTSADILAEPMLGLVVTGVLDSWNPSLAPFANGTASFSASPGYRFDIPRPPSDIYLAISATDSDAVSGEQREPAMAGAFRYGRLVLDPAHGSEQVESAMSARAEHWDGGGFALNVGDSCSNAAPANLVCIEELVGPVECADPLIAGGGLLSGGLSTLTLSPPGRTGTLRYGLTVDEWLRHDWNGDGTADDPTATATFGIYEGNPNMIHMRETWR